MSNRHPTKKKNKKPTSTHPPISIGKKEIALLRYVSEHQDLNIKAYSRTAKIPRSTVYDMIDRLILKEFIIKPLIRKLSRILRKKRIVVGRSI